MNKEQLVKETIVLLASDLFKAIYERDACGGWGDAAEEIIRYAEKFEKELDWQEDDQRDYIELLEQYEERIKKELEL